jgi:hypothetical protein
MYQLYTKRLCNSIASGMEHVFQIEYHDGSVSLETDASIISNK